jgi:hypothetical protein
LACRFKTSLFGHARKVMMNDSSGNTTALVKDLAGTSLGLGVAELLAPGKVAALSGVDDTIRTRRVIQALGARECGHGAALLRGPNLTLLGAGVAAGNGRGRPRRGTITAAALSGIAGIDLYTALRTTRDSFT